MGFRAGAGPKKKPSTRKELDLISSTSFVTRRQQEEGEAIKWRHQQEVRENECSRDK